MAARFLGRLGPVIIALGLVSLLNDVASEMIIPLLPAYLATLPGGGALLIGVMEGTAESVAALLKLLSGWLSDRKGGGGIMIASGYAAASVARPLMGLATHAFQVVGLRIVDRIGKGLRTSPRDALIAASSVESSRGLSFSFHRAMDHAGALLGPTLAIVFISALGFKTRNVILISFIPGILSLAPLAAALIYARRGRKEAPEKKAAPLSPLSDLRGLGGNFYVYICVCCFFTLGNSSDLFLLLRASESGLKPALLPAVWIVLHLSKMLLSIPAGMLSDRIGRRKPIMIGWLIYFITYMLFSYAGGTLQFFLLFAFYGLFFAFTEGVERAFVSDLVPENRKGTAFGMYNFAVAVGALPASMLMGALYQWAGPHWAFGTGATMALVSSIGLLFVKEARKGVAP
jgi:MFS family permease